MTPVVIVGTGWTDFYYLVSSGCKDVKLTLKLKQSSLREFEQNISAWLIKKRDQRRECGGRHAYMLPTATMTATAQAWAEHLQQGSAMYYFSLSLTQKPCGSEMHLLLISLKTSTYVSAKTWRKEKWFKCQKSLWYRSIYRIFIYYNDFRQKILHLIDE